VRSSCNHASSDRNAISPTNACAVTPTITRSIAPTITRSIDLTNTRSVAVTNKRSIALTNTHSVAGTNTRSIVFTNVHSNKLSNERTDARSIRLTNGRSNDVADGRTIRTTNERPVTATNPWSNGSANVGSNAHTNSAADRSSDYSTKGVSELVWPRRRRHHYCHYRGSCDLRVCVSCPPVIREAEEDFQAEYCLERTSPTGRDESDVQHCRGPCCNYVDARTARYGALPCSHVILFPPWLRCRLPS
jgi:hypothetical protein